MKDLTKGYPAKIIFMFALPLILGNVFQQFYNMADSKIVSMFVGTSALAAVGSTSIISNTLIGFVNGLTQGFAILIANSFGARDEKRMRKYVAGTIILTTLVAVVLTLLGEMFIKNILHGLSTPEDIFTDALSYVRIIIFGNIFVAMYNMCANTLRGVGDSKRPLYCLLLGIGINIFLDFILVGPMKMGIRGAAYATVISQMVSAVCCLFIVLVKFREILPHKEDWKLDEGQYQGLVTTGLSMGLMSCIVNIGTIVLQGAINSLGTKIVAAHTASRRAIDVLMVALYTIGLAMTTFVSQNVGAKRPDRVRQGVKHALIMVTVLTTILIIICFAFGETIICWLTSTDDAEIINASVMYIHVSVVFFYVLGPLFVLRCSLQGMGRKIIPVCSSILEMVIKVLSAMLLVPALKYFGVALTEPISWFAMTVLLFSAYLAKSPEKILEENK
ncbi:MAG: MATE family efflux transporter [Lachnospiraceae bacterium]